MTLKTGSRGDQVERLQEGLAFLGYHPGPIDGIYGKGTETAVEQFQKKKGLIADGIFGRSSLRAYTEALEDKALSEFSVQFANPSTKKLTAPKDKLSWVKCPADKLGKNAPYSSLTLRSDAAKMYKLLVEEVRSRGGVVTTAGGKRGLGSKASPSRSKKSMHYVGRAFDLALPSGMQNPEQDPYIITRVGTTRKWVVWCRSDSDGAKEITLDACYVVGKKTAKGKRYTVLRTKKVTAKVINFTKVAMKYGFRPISGRRSFFSGGSYSGAEWWHFQWETGLQKGSSTFGEELLKTYTTAEAEKFVYWDEAKDAQWQIDWF